MRALAFGLLALAACEGTVSEMPAQSKLAPGDAGAPSMPPLDSGLPMNAPDSGLSAPDAGGVMPAPDAGQTMNPLDAGVGAALTLQFPPPGCATSDPHLLFHGTTRAGLAVTAVTVGGTQATSSDGFATWEADVALALGQNAFDVAFTSGGQVQATPLLVQVDRFATEDAVMRGSGGWSGRVLGVAWDAVGQRLILADDIDDGVWGASASTGDRVELANSESNKIGGGVDITQPRSGVVRGTTSYVLDVPSDGGVDQPNVTALDLNTGDRSIAAQLPAPLNDLTLLPNGVEAIGASLDLKSVLAVNLDTGAVRVVSSSTVGSGVAAGNFGPLGLSAARRTAYVGLRYQDTIVAVDIDTGARTDFSSAAAGEPTFSDPEFIAVDDATQRVFVWDSKQLVAIDLGTGRRTLFGTGPFAWATAVNAMTATPFGIAIVDYVPSWEPPPQRAPTLVVFDALTGTRVVVSR